MMASAPTSTSRSTTMASAPSTVVDVPGGKNVSISGTKVSFDTEYGRMTFDFSNGKLRLPG